MSWPLNRTLTDDKEPTFNPVFHGSTGSGSDVTQGPSAGSFNTAYELEISVQPSNATDNYPFAVPPVARILNVEGFPISIAGTSIMLSVASGSTVGLLSGNTILPSSSTGMVAFNTVAFNSSITTAVITLTVTASGLVADTSVAVQIQPAPPSVDTYNLLFPNRPMPSSSTAGILGSWTTIMDIRWGMQGMNGGIEGSVYTAIPFNKAGSDHTRPNGSFIVNNGTDAAGGTFPGDYSSIVSILDTNAAPIAGNLGGNCLLIDFPIGFPGGYSPVRTVGISGTTGPAYGMSFSSLSRVKSIYAAHWIYMPSTFSAGGGVGYKGIGCTQVPPSAALAVNHFFNGWEIPAGAGSNKFGFYCLTQNPFTSWRPPQSGALSGVTVNSGVWQLQEVIMITPSDYSASNGTILLFENGVLKRSSNTFRMFTSLQSAYLNNFNIQFLTGGAGFGTPSGQSCMMGPVLVMGDTDALPSGPPNFGSPNFASSQMLKPNLSNNDEPTAALAALNIPAMVGGSSFTMPVTGARVLKVTSLNYPSTSSTSVWHHNYSEGPNCISGMWDQAGHYTVCIAGESVSESFLIDCQRGGTSSNTRVSPDVAAQCSFSNISTQYGIMYVHTGSAIRRYDTRASAYSDVAPFPLNGQTFGGWFQHDRNDRWFAWITGSGRVRMWDSQSSTTVDRPFNTLDEPYLDLDGRYCFVNHAAYTMWDGQSNTTVTITPPANAGFGHVPSMRGWWVASDTNTGAGITPMYVSASATPNTFTFATNCGGYMAQWHRSCWPQASSTTDQWFMISTFNVANVTVGSPLASVGSNGLGYYKIDSSQTARILGWHYSRVMTLFGSNMDYYTQPHAQTSPDGGQIIYASNMSNSGRVDTFVIEVPMI